MDALIGTELSTLRARELRERAEQHSRDRRVRSTRNPAPRLPSG